MVAVGASIISPESLDGGLALFAFWRHPVQNIMPFEFEVPISFFEKADAPKGQQRRIGGIISTESPDRQGEIVLQKGLDFTDFVKNGWFNDNHNKDTDGIVGYPEAVQFFQKGAALPNGENAPSNGHWAEGYMLDGHDRADRLWKLGKALQGTGRSLGYSVEGNIHRRIGPKTVFQKSAKGKGSWVGNTIARATVRNVAVTNCPVNVETGLAVLAKSLQVTDEMDGEDFASRLETLEKALSMGTPNGNDAPVGAKTGEGAGQVISGQSLEQDDDPRLSAKKKKGDDGDEEASEATEKSLSFSEGAEWIRTMIPHATLEQAARFVQLTKALKGQGQL